jgi:hypothetical protein
MAHRRISQNILWKFLVQNILKDELEVLVELYGHLGVLISHLMQRIKFIRTKFETGMIWKQAYEKQLSRQREIC